MIHRWADTAVEAALQDTPVVLVHGPRQAGKSTLVREASERAGDRLMVTLDDPEPLALAKANPAEFLHAYPPPVTIDEVQRAPELFLPMKAWVDRKRVPGSFLLTGSANVLMLPKMADSLAGRMEIIDLFPLSQAEIEGTRTNAVDAFFAPEFSPRGLKGEPERLPGRIVTGGYPEPVTRSAARRLPWFQAYVRTILDRDVRDIAQIEGLTQMPRLLGLLAARAGSTLNIASLARDTGIAHTTLTRYIDLLRSIFLIRFVPAWSVDAGAKFTKTPKAYLVDTGLLCHLERLDEKGLTDRDRLGPVLENFVAAELAKLADQSEARPFLTHLRTVKQKEVDFVLDAQSRGVVGIQVRPTRTVHPNDLEGLRFLSEVVGDRFVRGILLYAGEEAKPVGKDLWALPIDALWRL
jgi:predicted AAA+ superfamily ATPase